MILNHQANFKKLTPMLRYSTEIQQAFITAQRNDSVHTKK
jgi:hypothetical protein